MTIKEAASLYGVSTQAIYQRIAKNGKKAKEITNPQTGDLTDNGAALLASWFTNDQTKEVGKACSRCKELEKDIAALQAEKQSLQDQLTAMQADKERLYSLLNQAQQTAQALTLARIGGQSKKEVRPIWERFRVFIMGEKPDNIQG